MGESDTVRKNLQNLLDLRGWSHELLSMRSGVSRSTISKFLAQTRYTMGVGKAVRIAKALNVSLDWLAEMPRRANELTPEEEILVERFRQIQMPECRKMVLEEAAQQVVFDQRIRRQRDS